MPYENEHSARVRNPGDFQADSFRRKNITTGVDVIMGKLKGESMMTTQAYRFNIKYFTADEAKTWCKEHNIKYILFEAATGGKEMKNDIYKSLNYEIKDLDGPQGIVTFYANSFDKKDSDGDIIIKGSFKKTLKENFKRIRHLLNHYDSIGVPISIKEDNFGLLVQSQLIMGKQIARETFEEYKVYAELENTMEHSIRLDIVKFDEDRESETRIIREAKLWDVSTIDKWGANQWTPQLALKQFDSVEDAIKTLELLLKGRFSEDRLENIEQALNTLKSLINEPHSTQDDEPIDINVMLDKYELFKTK